MVYSSKHQEVVAAVQRAELVAQALDGVLACAVMAGFPPQLSVAEPLFNAADELLADLERLRVPGDCAPEWRTRHYSVKRRFARIAAEWQATLAPRIWGSGRE